MFEVLKSENRTFIVDDRMREVDAARRHAIEQSRLDDAVYAVRREGYGDCLFFVWRGQVGDVLTTLARLNAADPVPVLPGHVSNTHNVPVDIVEVEPMAEPSDLVELDELEAMLISDLRDLARELDIPGRSGMNKDELIAAIRAAHGQPGPLEFKATDPDKREYKQSTAYVIETKVSEDGREGIVEAIVNTYGIIDDGHDMTHPGWLAKTIVENGPRIRVLNSHNSWDVLSAVGKPVMMREIGRGELPPDVLERFPEATGGFWTQTQFMLSDPTSKAVFDRIDAGWIDEWSIGFETLQSDRSYVKRTFNGAYYIYDIWLANVDEESERVTDERGNPIQVRHLRQGRLWEYSPVLWGMNAGTSTVRVKGNGEGREDKAGPILSKHNFEAIKQAYALLTTVMESMGLTDDRGVSDDLDTPLEDSTDDATDGPSVSTDAPTSTPEAGPQDDETPASKRAELLATLQQRLAEEEDHTHDHEGEDSAV